MCIAFMECKIEDLELNFLYLISNRFITKKRKNIPLLFKILQNKTEVT